MIGSRWRCDSSSALRVPALGLWLEPWGKRGSLYQRWLGWTDGELLEGKPPERSQMPVIYLENFFPEPLPKWPLQRATGSIYWLTDWRTDWMQFFHGEHLSFKIHFKFSLRIIREHLLNKQIFFLQTSTHPSKPSSNISMKSIRECNQGVNEWVLFLVTYVFFLKK